MKQIKKMTISFLILFTFFIVQAQAMTTQGARIVNSQGEPIDLKGINWFGFNNQSTMVDGLWGGPDSISFDFATAVYRMQLLGFNAIRLPFSFKDIFQVPPRNYTQNCVQASISQIQASVTNPSVPVQGKTIPPMIAPPNRAEGKCNDYLPNDTTLNRFLWVINFFAKNGFYVLIDNHLREDQTVLESPERWVQYWVQLVTAISKDPISSNMLMIDILNEPDNFGLRWEASGGRPALKDLYISAMDALYQIAPKALFFIEGTGQGGIGANWGDGFATDPTLISQNGLSDPNPFFKEVINKPYKDQIVISPHVYPPSVTGASSNYTGAGLWNRMSSSFGYLTQKGYCVGTNCKVFPVAVGEFGSRFTEERDLQSMQDMARYFNNSDGAADGKHTAIGSWFYWAWNANSGDTGGIVQDNWRDIVWKKIDYLTTIALKPWYLGPQVPAKKGTLCVSVSPVPGLTKESLQAVIVGDQSFTFADFSQPACAELNVGNYTIVPPVLSSSGKQFKADSQSTSVVEGQTSTVEIHYVEQTQPAPGNFVVGVQTGTPWQESGSFKNVLNLYIKNTGDTPVNVPWTIKITNGSYIAATSWWNLKPISVENGVIKAVNGVIPAIVDSNWQTLQPKGGNTVNIGLIISGSSQDFKPTSITINDIPVTIQ